MTQTTEAVCLKADALELERGERLLFTGLTFEAPAGTLVRLAGANGTGKTSLLRLLTGLMQPDAGEILYKGEPIRTLKEDYYKDLVYIGHLNGVKDDLSAIENVRIAARMGNIIAKSYKVMAREQPDAVLILGDTNSALSAISAKRLKIPIFHMEAGNRCWDWNVSEMINRKIVDHISDINLPYTENSRRYLLSEGIDGKTIFVTGSPMREVLERHREQIAKSDVLSRLGLELSLIHI